MNYMCSDYIVSTVDYRSITVKHVWTPRPRFTQCTDLWACHDMIVDQFTLEYSVCV